ncbi:MAG: hypothetical protein IPN70_04655 [Candidatus Moraniibacteriota bacterium]|nr:MAG: hypothetical protein IPN70_04655 [Candidatus Moranbacteria bacterium]
MIRRLLEVFVFSLVFLLVGSILGFFLVPIETSSESDKESKCITFVYNESGQMEGIFIRNDIKTRAQEIAHTFSDVLYEKATLYNPKGDMVPDSIDDNIKLYIEKIIL